MKLTNYSHTIAACGLLALMAMPSTSQSQDEGRAADATPAASAAASSPTAPPPATPAEIAAWISELDSREFRVRERATRQLLAAGAPALGALLTAANGDRPEPADRAVWIMQRLAQNVDQQVAEAALKRLVQLQDRPQLVAKAQSELQRIGIAACERHLKALGAECSTNVEPITMLGYAQVFRVRLGANWRGTSKDLQPLADLHNQLHIALEGPAVDDAVLKLFEARPSLIWMHLLNTKISVAAVDALKTRHPNALVYLKNRALMGVACQNHADGALVMTVEPGEAAHAAGVVAGDVITAIDGRKLPDFDRLTAHIAQHEPGDRITIEVLRGEEKRTLEVTLGSWAEFEKRRGGGN